MLRRLLLVLLILLLPAAAHAVLCGGGPRSNTTYSVGSLIPEGALVEVELDAAVDLPK